MMGNKNLQDYYFRLKPAGAHQRKDFLDTKTKLRDDRSIAKTSNPNI